MLDTWKYSKSFWYHRIWVNTWGQAFMLHAMVFDQLWCLVRHLKGFAAGVSSHILLAPDVDQWSEKWVNFTPRLGSFGRGLATDEGGLLRVGPPALWYLWLWILFYLGKGPGTQWHRRGAKQQHGDNNNEHFRIMQCIAMRFWSILICVLIWYWNSGFSWRSSWNVSGSGMLRSLLHPIWWNATKVWKPFTIWPRGYRGGWSSRPCDKQCRAVVHWFMFNQREVHRCTAWALSPFFHQFERNWFRLWGCLLILEKTRWDESNCVEVAVFFFRCFWGVTTSLLW